MKLKATEVEMFLKRLFLLVCSSWDPLSWTFWTLDPIAEGKTEILKILQYILLIALKLPPDIYVNETRI